MVDASTEGQTALETVTWEDHELSDLLRIQHDFKRFKKAFFEENETSEGLMKKHIKERAEANGMGELDGGQVVTCGDFIFTIAEWRKAEETVIAPYVSKGISGLEEN